MAIATTRLPIPNTRARVIDENESRRSRLLRCAVCCSIPRSQFSATVCSELRARLSHRLAGRTHHSQSLFADCVRVRVRRGTCESSHVECSPCVSESAVARGLRRGDTDARETPAGAIERCARVPVGQHSVLPVATCFCAARRGPRASSSARRFGRRARPLFWRSRRLPLPARAAPRRGPARLATLSLSLQSTSRYMSIEQMPCHTTRVYAIAMRAS